MLTTSLTTRVSIPYISLPAMSMEPNNPRLQEALFEIGENLHGLRDSALDIDMDEMDSDIGDTEESENEAAGSDGDVNMAASNSSSR